MRVRCAYAIVVCFCSVVELLLVRLKGAYLFFEHVTFAICVFFILTCKMHRMLYFRTCWYALEKDVQCHVFAIVHLYELDFHCVVCIIRSSDVVESMMIPLAIAVKLFDARLVPSYWYLKDCA